MPDPDPNDCKTADDDACDYPEPDPDEELPEEPGPEPEACPMNMTSSLAVANSEAKLSFDFWSFIFLPNPDGSAAASSQNTATCDGAGNIVAVFNHPDNAGWQCPAIRECTEVHEKSHISDMIAQNPDVCKGVPGGIPVANNDNEEIKQTELAAFQAELSCLAEKKNDKCAMAQNNCASEIQQAETYIKTDAIPRVKAGTYGK